jgi:very-short-patch-repair endonuclease
LAVLAQIQSAGLDGWEPEYRFCPTERWRFDFAFPELKLALEIDGGGIGHGHFNPWQREKEHQKFNMAATLGWRVLRGSTRQAETGELFAWLKLCLKEGQSV